MTKHPPPPDQNSLICTWFGSCHTQYRAAYSNFLLNTSLHSLLNRLHTKKPASRSCQNATEIPSSIGYKTSSPKTKKRIVFSIPLSQATLMPEPRTSSSLHASCFYHALTLLRRFLAQRAQAEQVRAVKARQTRCCVQSALALGGAIRARCLQRKKGYTKKTIWRARQG